MAEMKRIRVGDRVLSVPKNATTEEIQAILDGSVPDARPSQQRTISFDEAFQRPESMLPEPLETAASFVGQSLLKGGSKLARGVASSPFDIASYFTEDPEAARQQAARGEAVRQAIPEFTGGMAGTDLAGTIAQYAVPATVGYKAFRAAAPLLGLGSRAAYPAGILGAAAGDVLATVPEEAESIGSLVGYGPTKIESEDPALTRRVKTGAETLALGPIVDLALAVPRGAKRLVRGPETEVAEHLQKYAEDVPAAIASIKKSLEITPPAGYSPTAAELTEDTGLRGIQQNVSKAPSLVRRKEQNLKALSDEARSFAEGIEDPYLFKTTVDDFVESATSASKEAVTEFETKLTSAEEDLAGELASIAASSSREVKEAASENLTKALSDENIRLKEESSRLYKAIDPDKSLFVDIRPLSKIADDIRKPTSELKRAEVNETVRYGKEVFDSIDAALGAQVSKGKAQSYSELISFRSTINSAISKAYADNAAPAIKNLSLLRDGIDRYTELLAQQGSAKVQRGAKAIVTPHTHFKEIPAEAAEAAIRANKFYKEEYAPKFKESLGGEFVKKMRSGKLFPTQTAKSFLLGPTEGAQQLSRIIADADNPEFAQSAVREFMVSQLAQSMFNKKGDVYGPTARAFYNRYKPVLQSFPELDSEIKNITRNFEAKSKIAGSLQAEVKAARAAQKASLPELRRSNLRFFLDDSDPDVIVSRIFSGDAPENAIRELKGRFGSNEQFMDSLRSGVRDHITRVIKNPALEGGFSVGKALNIIDMPKTQKALKEIYSPSEIAKLNAVKSRLRDIVRSEEKTSVPRILGGENFAERARILLASVYGIIRGRAIFAISKMIGNQFVDVSPKEAAEELLTRSMLDPELAVEMLKKDTKATQDGLRTYILNNLVGAEPEQE
jgi:hypothetical protein